MRASRMGSATAIAKAMVRPNKIMTAPSVLLGARCGSAACRVCGRRFRNHFAGHLAELIANDDADWWAVTLVPPDRTYPLGGLRQFSPSQFKDRIRKQLERSVLADAAVVLGIDFAVQIFSQPTKAPLWRPHVYKLMRGHSTKSIHAALDHYYPRGPHTPRPSSAARSTKKRFWRSLVTPSSANSTFDHISAAAITIHINVHWNRHTCSK